MNDSAVILAINQAIVAFEVVTGLKPLYIYVGDKQWQQLRVECFKQWGFAPKMYQGSELFSLKLFKIDHADHIGVGR